MVRGLKFGSSDGSHGQPGRITQVVRGLKYDEFRLFGALVLSHHASGAWIEIADPALRRQK